MSESYVIGEAGGGARLVDGAAANKGAAAAKKATEGERNGVFWLCPRTVARRRSELVW